MKNTIHSTPQDCGDSNSIGSCILNIATFTWTKSNCHRCETMFPVHLRTLYLWLINAVFGGARGQRLSGKKREVKYKVVLAEFSCDVKTWSLQCLELPSEHGPWCRSVELGGCAAPTPITVLRNIRGRLSVVECSPATRAVRASASFNCVWNTRHVVSISDWNSEEVLLCVSCLLAEDSGPRIEGRL